MKKNSTVWTLSFIASLEADTVQIQQNVPFHPRFSPQSHYCDETNQSVLTFVKEWPVRHRNIYSITVHGVNTADGARVVLSIKNKTEVQSFLLGSYWLFYQVYHHLK